MEFNIITGFRTWLMQWLFKDLTFIKYTVPWAKEEAMHINKVEWWIWISICNFCWKYHHFLGKKNNELLLYKLQANFCFINFSFLCLYQNNVHQNLLPLHQKIFSLPSKVKFKYNLYQYLQYHAITFSRIKFQRLFNCVRSKSMWK